MQFQFQFLFLFQLRLLLMLLLMVVVTLCSVCCLLVFEQASRTALCLHQCPPNVECLLLLLLILLLPL